MQALFTIGHSNHSREAFVQLLGAHNIAQVVDVRTFPSSQFSPQFNQQELKLALAAAGIEYIYAGQQLGGRKRLAYSEQRQTSGFRQALRDLIQQSQDRPTAMMCAEEDPYQCHRRFLISRALMEDFAFLDIAHIRKDATLVVEPGFPEASLQLTLGI